MQAYSTKADWKFAIYLFVGEINVLKIGNANFKLITYCVLQAFMNQVP